MQFPFIELRPGVFCPVIALHFRGPGGEVVSDGLLDTGSERTLITTKLARSLGIDPDQLPTAFQLRSATGHSSSCKMRSLPLQLRRDNESISWMAEVLILQRYPPLPCTQGRGDGGEGYRLRISASSSPSPPTPLPRSTGGEGSKSLRIQDLCLKACCNQRCSISRLTILFLWRGGGWGKKI